MPSTQCTDHQCEETSRKLVKIVRVHSGATNTNQSPCSIIPFSSTIVLRTKKIFARYGSPMVCRTDNGPQFIARETTVFAKDWNFKHITSSPYHSQGNGHAEATVKAVKNILRKCQDPQLELLYLRNTPTKGNQTSPTQRLMSHTTRTTVPTSTLLLKPEIVDAVAVKEEMTAQRKVTKLNCDKKKQPQTCPC